MADASEGDNGTLRTVGGGGNRAPSTMRFSVQDSNVASPRSAGGGGSRAPRTMDECEGVKKCIIMKEKGGGSNGTLRMTGGGGNGVLLAMRFSVEGSNGAPPRSTGRGGNGPPRMIDECEGGN